MLSEKNVQKSYFALLSVGGCGALVTFLLLIARPGFELEDTLLALVEVALCGGGNNIGAAVVFSKCKKTCQTIASKIY